MAPTRKNNTVSAAALDTIADAAARAVKAVADAAMKASELLASNTAEAAKIVNGEHTGDHDLLIRVDTKLEGLKEDIKNMADGTSKKVTDHETRIGNLETARTTTSTMLTIGIGLITILVSLMIYHIVMK